MYFINLLIDGEPCEVQLSLNDIYSKCIKCGTIYRQFFSTEELQHYGPPTESDFIFKNCCRNCFDAYLGSVEQPSKAKTVADMIFKLTGSAIPRDLISSWLQEQEETGNSEILTAHIKEHLLNANAPG